MGLFDSADRDEKVMGSFILSEIRDLRKGMEGRDGELRGEIAAVRDAVATLSESVSRSHTKADGIQTDMETMSNDLRRLRVDIDEIQSSTHFEKIKSGSAWDGPKKLLGATIAVAAGVAAISAIVKVWPILLAFGAL